MRRRKPVGCACPMINGKTLNDTISTSVSSLPTDIRIGLVPVSGNKQEIIPCEGYEIVAKFNKYYLVKSKARYPKTYAECCEVLFPSSIELGKVLTSGYNCEKLKKFGELLICRYAYWKIAGDWEEKRKGKAMHYVIYSTLLGEVVKDKMPNCIANCLLDFPSEEMRDAFYENFKELIENCKDLL